MKFCSPLWYLAVFNILIVEVLFRVACEGITNAATPCWHGKVKNASPKCPMPRWSPFGV